MITRRNIFLGLFAVASTGGVAIASTAKTSNRQTRWVVPPGVNEINVKSWRKDGSKVMNYNFDVEPGQTFLLTAK